MSLMSHFKIPSEYSCLYTSENHALQINTILLKYLDKNSKITDATGGIGGNSIFFCRDFSFVNVVEKDENIINTLKENLKDFKNKTIILSDYVKIMKTLKQDIVFIDPPWGGKGYKNQPMIKLYLSDIDIYDIIENLYDNTKLVCLKAPVNFDLKTSKKWRIYKYPIYRFSYVIFNIIIYKNDNNG